MLQKQEEDIERNSKSLKEKRRELDNREVCLGRNKKDLSLESQKRVADMQIC